MNKLKLIVEHLLSGYWLYGIVLVLSVVGLSFFYTLTIYQVEPGLKLEQDAPRLIMHDINATNYAPDGTQKISLRSDKASQFVDNHLRLNNPVVTLYDNNLPNITLRSRQTIIDGSHYRFIGWVRVNFTSQPLFFRSQQLDYYHDSNTIISSKPIVTSQTNNLFIRTSADQLEIREPMNTLLLVNNVVTTISELTP